MQALKLKKEKKPAERGILTYSNIGDPFVSLRIYRGGALADEATFHLEASQLDHGVPISPQYLAGLLSERFGTVPKLELILQVKETFRAVESIPKISRYRADALAKKNLREAFPDREQKYLHLNTFYRHALGYAYIAYFIPRRFLTAIRQTAGLLGTSVVSYTVPGAEITARFLARKKDLPDRADPVTESEGRRRAEGAGNAKTPAEDAVLLSVCGAIANLTVLAEGHMISTADFAVTSPEILAREVALRLGKHESELEKKPVSVIYLDTEDEVIADTLGRLVEIRPAEIDRSTYLSVGEKL